MVPEAAVAMLACTRIGAVHSVVFGGFAPKELASRIEAAEAKAVVCADFGLEGSSKIVPYTSNVVKAIEMCDHDVSNLVIFQRPEVSHQSQDVASSKKMNVHDFQKLLDDRSITCEDAVALNANDPLYTIYTVVQQVIRRVFCVITLILFLIVRGVRARSARNLITSLKYFDITVSLTYIVEFTTLLALRAQTQVHDGTLLRMQKGETFAAFSDIGWVVGHSYSVYGPLIHGCKSVMFEGKPVEHPMQQHIGE